MKLSLLGLVLIAIASAPVAAQSTDAPVADVIPEALTETGDAPVAAETVAETETLLIVDASEVDPEDFLWDRRIVAVLANSPRDPAFIRQMEDIRARAADLLERDVVVIFDGDRNSGSLLRQRLRPRGFMLAIIEKDGQIKQRRPAPRSVREISSAIDHFPLRQQEMLERRPAGR
ncbi:DUF4174 domain-containing protein [Pararhodobacter oceanensis]|uniref:DUF4174 domain-containing protein n=1 Tax=Pararhodobacter oceanensis TaxID=2172121 RepID=UPI003A907B15